MKPTSEKFFIGERVVCEGGRWGVVSEVKRLSIIVALDNGTNFNARIGGLWRHGDYVVNKNNRFQDPKGVEESKRCFVEAIKTFPTSKQDRFLQSTFLGRLVLRDREAVANAKIDLRLVGNEAINLLVEVLAAWESIPEDEQVPEAINKCELWDNVKECVVKAKKLRETRDKKMT